jgi:hypothetical protein
LFQLKSGNFFFWTHDGLFLAKTISNDELETFKKTMKNYFEVSRSIIDKFQHLIKYPHTLLTKYYGLYSINGVHFVIMGNVFDQKMDEIYDLKGSTHGRTNKTGKGILKDLDFIALNKKLKLGMKSKEIIDQIIFDVDFLQSCSIIDYSLLVGICYDSQSKSEVYYLGIIGNTF